MTREEFCNKIEVMCFECGEMCDKYNNEECVNDVCKKNLVAQYEQEIRADERAKTIDDFYNRLSKYKCGINTANYPWNYIELVVRELVVRDRAGGAEE